MGFSASPAYNMEFKYQQHKAVLNAVNVIEEADHRFGQQFGRKYGGMVAPYRCEDAEIVLIALGSVCGTCRIIVDKLREEGQKVGLLKIRYMRPFPEKEIIQLAQHVKAVGVIDKDISFGYEGTVYTNVNSALAKAGKNIASLNFIAGLGGRDITKENIREMFRYLQEAVDGNITKYVHFIGLGVDINE